MSFVLILTFEVGKGQRQSDAIRQGAVKTATLIFGLVAEPHTQEQKT